MASAPSDAIVFFGATGDLAYKQIFPSLLGLVREEGLNVPIIGVAKADLNGTEFVSRNVERSVKEQPDQSLASVTRWNMRTVHQRAIRIA